jgi:hypothetical protein
MTLRLLVLPILFVLPCAAPARAQTLRVPAGHVVVIDTPGATAAYAVDHTIADVVLGIDTVRVQGRLAGRTKLVVVIGDTLRSHDVEVVAPPRGTPLRAGRPGVTSSMWTSLFNSETDRLTTTADATSERAGRTVRLSAANVTRIGDAHADVRSSMASASLDVSSSARRVTFLDQLVRGTPLTLDGSRVRGLHYADRAFEVHAGLSSPLLYRSVLVPADPDAVLGGAYTRRQGAVAISPSVHWYPRDSAFGGAPGVATAVRVARTPSDGRLQMAAEGGYGGEFAASGNLGYTGSRHQVSLSGLHRPARYPSLGAARPYGTSFDGHWTARLSEKLRFHLATNGARQELPASTQRTGSANAEIRAQMGRHWTFTTGTVAGLFDNGASRLTSLTVPLGAGWESPERGITGLVRYQQNTDRNRGGTGGRVRAHAGVGRLRTSGFIDYQRDAATVGLVFREAPELARLFAELGLQTRTPEDLARLLREEDGLVASGYLERATLILNPRRVQVGLDAAWRSRGDGTHLLFSVLADRVDTTSRTSEHLLQTLSLRQRITGGADLIATATRWATAVGGASAGHWAYSLGMRVRGSPLADVTSWLRGDAIAGRVLRDDSVEGGGTARAPLPGVRVRLDDGREVVTDAAGGFRFARAGRGPRQVEALLPASAGARFTTPSVLSAEPGHEVTFTIGHVAARVFGFVRDDSGAPIRGVQIRGMCGPAQVTAITNSEGRYTLTHAEGECRVGLDLNSLPAGYDGADLRPRSVRLARNAPAHADYVVRAHRSLVGTVGGSDGATTVRLLETGEERRPDAAGRFVFRNLKPGTYTVSAVVGDRRVERRVDIPDGPALVNVTLNLP